MIRILGGHFEYHLVILLCGGVGWGSVAHSTAIGDTTSAMTPFVAQDPPEGSYIQKGAVGHLELQSCGPATEHKNPRIPKMQQNTSWGREVGA